jgi:hypothetical protein
MEEKAELRNRGNFCKEVELLHTQNLSGRETESQLYKQGILDCLQELEEIGVIKYPLNASQVEKEDGLVLIDKEYLDILQKLFDSYA